MKTTKSAFPDLPLFENPRLLDRLLAACMVVLAVMVVAMGALAIQQQSAINRPEQKTIEIQMPAKTAYTPQIAQANHS